MDKREIIRKLYERGVLPSASELKGMPEEKLRQLLEGGAGRDETRVSENSGGISITTAKHAKSKKMSAQDITNYYNNKYEKIRGMLLKRMDAVSITNAKTDPSPCGIIGIVGGMTQLGFMFEDPTGEIEVVKSGVSELEGIGLDDVLGLKGFVRENRFFPKEVVWPGIPLNRGIGRIKGAVISLSCANGPGLSVTMGEATNNIEIRESPEWIYISRGGDRVIILAFRAPNATREIAVSYLNRRCLPEPNPIRTTENHCLMEDTPDILWLIQDGEWAETYKGTTIISCGGKSQAVVDLGTREVRFEKPANTFGSA